MSKPEHANSGLQFEDAMLKGMGYGALAGVLMAIGAVVLLKMLVPSFEMDLVISIGVAVFFVPLLVGIVIGMVINAVNPNYIGKRWKRYEQEVEQKLRKPSG